jgi:thiol:disulfide interchange protein
LKWYLEFEEGRAAAKAQGKDLLIDFGGSDWCAACKWIKDRVFSKAEFIELAGDAFVLVDIDLPVRSPIPADRKRRYEGVRPAQPLRLVVRHGVPPGYPGP